VLGRVPGERAHRIREAERGQGRGHRVTGARVPDAQAIGGRQMRETRSREREERRERERERG